MVSCVYACKECKVSYTCFCKFYITVLAGNFVLAGSVCINGKVFNTSKLGSTMMKTMLKEVSGFCHPQRRSTWSSNESTRLQVRTLQTVFRNIVAVATVCVCIGWFYVVVFDHSFQCQLIYDIKDGEGCFHLIAINVSSEDLEEFRVMGVQPPPPQWVYSGIVCSLSC